MAIDRDLIAAVSRAFHGRSDFDEATLAKTARRVAGFIAQSRLIDERGLQPVPPAFSFDPGAAPYQAAPQVGAPLYQRLTESAGAGGAGIPTGFSGAAAPPPSEWAPSASVGPDFLWWSATDLAAAIRRRALSPVEVTRAALDRLAAADKALNAFVTVTEESAMAEARAAEQSPSERPLHGVPIGLKDLFETAGVRTTAGSQLLADNVPSRDATAVRLLKQAGAIVLGKTATHEFAFGTTSNCPYHGAVHNPWDLDRIPAGSSGGSGAAVGAGIVPIAMGSDTAGSIRLPAAHCGTVGLKPTFGRISKAGVIPLSWSLDHVGPLCRSVADAALVLSVLAGPDPLDPSALPVPAEDCLAAALNPPARLDGVRIGVPAEWLEGDLDAEVRTAYEQGLQRLKDLGAEVVEVVPPPVDVMNLVNRLILLGEAGAYHAPLLSEQADAYSTDVRQRLDLAQFVSAREYLLGQRLRTEIVRQVNAVMTGVEVIATPTAPIPAALIGQALWEYESGRKEAVPDANIRFCGPFNVTGQPAISVPCGFTRAGLPVGMQLVGRAFGEAGLLRVAAAFEAAGGAARRPGV